MTWKNILLLIFISTQALTFCQNKSISPSKIDDEYSNYIIKLKQGDTKIDYKLFRESLLKSGQYQVIIKSKHILDSLGGLMFQAEKEQNYDDVIRIANNILSIDFTNIISHKLISQAYNFKGDSANRRKYAAIENGLLNSIFNNGDGKSCATAWHIVRVTEEGFILQILKGNVIDMEINKASLCDIFTVELNGAKQKYFFKRINETVQ